MAKAGLIEQFTLDFVSATGTRILSMPFDFLKLILQCQPELVRSGVIAVPYSGAVNCISRTIKEDGISAFYRGIAPALITPLITSTINFSGLLSRFRSRYNPNRPYLVNFVFSLVAGGIAGTIPVIITCPLDYARTQLACDVSHKYTGVTDVIQKTIESDGFFSMYRSIGATILGIVIYRGLYFALYDSLQPLITRRQRRHILTFVIGFGITIVAGFLTYPIDTIRRRMLVSLTGPHPYQSAIECTREIISTEGVTSLWRGAGVNVVRAQFSSLAIVLFDQIQSRYLSWRFPAPPPPPPSYGYEEQQTQ
jgi:solute carrier family 25 (mitochondrial adenine nucleotide translocator), member 4/5/6/31